ncbi:MAG: tetratricopeptide repeat protein [Campylobacterales bacterium]
MGKKNLKIVGIVALFSLLKGGEPLPPLPVVATQCSYQHLNCKMVGKFPDRERGRFLQKSLERCQKGEREWCLIGGVVGRFGGDESVEKRVALFQKGCQLGSGESCYWLGEELKRVKKYREEVASFEKGCQLGSGLSCNGAGWVYWFGEGNRTIPKDLKKGAYYFLKGCQLGNGDSCNNLGVMVSEGEIQLKIEPAEFYNLGCQLGSGQGCTSFGYWLEGEDEQEPRNLIEAYHFYREGCKLGNGWGCSRAGEIQMRGVNSLPNYRLAKHFFEKGCQLGDGSGCSQLGELYASGKGVRKNLEKAYFYLKKGCEMGDFEWGCNRAAELEEELKRKATGK